MLMKEVRRLDIRKYSFSQKMIHEGNKLSNDCVNAGHMIMFKFFLNLIGWVTHI